MNTGSKEVQAAEGWGMVCQYESGRIGGNMVTLKVDNVKLIGDPWLKYRAELAWGWEVVRKFQWEEITTVITGAKTVSISFLFFLTGLHITKHTYSRVVVFQPRSEAGGKLESISIVLSCYITPYASFTRIVSPLKLTLPSSLPPPYMSRFPPHINQLIYCPILT